jgi:hypothetical protein
LREGGAARSRGRLTALTTPRRSSAPSHREGTLMLFAALALGLLSVAGASLLRLLRQLGGFGGIAHWGPLP